MGEARLWIAAILWFLTPPLGLHLLYLGRDQHFCLHVLTGGGCGIGWLRDGFHLRRFVRLANEESTTEPSATVGLARLAGMLLVGYMAGVVVGHLVPKDLPQSDGKPLSLMMQALGAAIGAGAVGSVPRSATTALRSSALRTLLGAAIGCAALPQARTALAALPFEWDAVRQLLPLSALPALGAALGFGSAARLERGRTPRWRTVGLPRRLACLAFCTFGASVAQQAAYALNAAEHEGLTFAEPAHPLLRSPMWWADARRDAYTLLRDELPAHGVRHVLTRAIELLDLSGEERARRVLGVGRDATAAELRRAYRALALRHHPDKAQPGGGGGGSGAGAGGSSAGGEAASEQRFREVQHAYELLSRGARRAASEAGDTEDAEAVETNEAMEEEATEEAHAQAGMDGEQAAQQDEDEPKAAESQPRKTEL